MNVNMLKTNQGEPINHEKHHIIVFAVPVRRRFCRKRSGKGFCSDPC